MSTTPETSELIDLKPRLVVIGVGGAGCNAVNNMIAADLSGVEYVVANTDAQALAASSAEHRIQLGAKLTEGLGAGSKPEIGQAAAEEAIELIRDQITGAHMVFIAAGMGGGTGTGAASIIADIAREQGILTVGVVTKPFQFEGARRMRIAEAGITELKDRVDTLIVIPNQNLFRLANEKTTFSEAFILADQVLYSGVACIVDLIIKEGLINLDFADVRTVISGMGSAMMGTGEAEGERRAIVAAEEAISNPLLDDVSLEGARGLLLSITGGSDLTLYEVDEAASRVREEVDPDANIIVGATFDESLGERVRVSIVASGMKKTGAFGDMSDHGSGHALPPMTDTPQPVSAAPAAHISPGAASSEPDTPFANESAQKDVSQSDRALLHGDPAMPSEALHSRLSEALQAKVHEVDTPTHASEWGDATDALAEDTPPPLPTAQHAQHGTADWPAHQPVTIEDGLPPISQPFAGAGHDLSRAESAEGAPEFVPAMTEAMPRSARRMPDLDDFPDHAQREYRQKQPDAGAGFEHDSVGSTSANSTGFTQTLLERLRLRAKGKTDSSVEKPSVYAAVVNEAGTGPFEAENSAQTDGEHRFDTEPVDQAQSADLPMFFGRMAK